MEMPEAHQRLYRRVIADAAVTAGIVLYPLPPRAGEHCYGHCRMVGGVIAAVGWVGLIDAIRKVEEPDSLGHRRQEMKAVAGEGVRVDCPFLTRISRPELYMTARAQSQPVRRARAVTERTLEYDAIGLHYPLG